MAARSPLFIARAVVMTLAVSALAMTLAAGPGTKMEAWPWQIGLGLLKYATYVGLAAALGALILIVMLVIRELRVKPWVPVLALVIALAAVAPPLAMLSRAKQYPLIHDVTTDTADPPAFVALMEQRKASPNGADYGGASVAALQQKGYPDLKAISVKTPPAETVQRALDAARALGWTIAGSDTAAGRIEATDTTAWFGFKDDVVIRVRPEGAGSRVDVRSASRVGLSDIGANAERIRKFLARLA